MNWEVVGYNVSLLIASIGLAFAAIQHAMFFYSFPPDISRYIDIPVVVYIMVGFLTYMLLKYTHFVEERGEMFPSEKEE